MSEQSEFERQVSIVKAKPNIEQDAQEVGAMYRSMFTPEGIASIDPERFKEFLCFKGLRFEGNRHWRDIQRHSGQLTADLPLLKRALQILVDENKPIADRIDEARGTGIRGLGQAVISAILQVAYPTKYGVYNRISVAGLTRLVKFPDDFGSRSLGSQYDYVNQQLKELGTRYDISLWALDVALGEMAPGSGRRKKGRDYPLAFNNWREYIGFTSRKSHR
jgi:hypothetical protein